MTIIHWIVLTVSILIAAFVVPGVHVSILSALVLAVLIGLINVFIKPILNLLTLPLNIVTLGIFSLVLNALIIMLLGMWVPGFGVSGFWAAFFFSIVVSLINALFSMGARKV